VVPAGKAAVWEDGPMNMRDGAASVFAHVDYLGCGLSLERGV
jgi:hypothetical protein